MKAKLNFFFRGEGKKTFPLEGTPEDVQQSAMLMVRENVDKEHVKSPELIVG